MTVIQTIIRLEYQAEEAVAIQTQHWRTHQHLLPHEDIVAVTHVQKGVVRA